MKTVQRYTYSLWAMSRPLFLLGIIPLYALGVAIAWYDNNFVQVPKMVSGIFLVWLVQLMTHHNNEYYDLETDLATETSTHISGGSRVLVRRLVPSNIARVVAITCLLLAVILTIFMVVVMKTGLSTLAFAGIAIFLGWFYSAKPLKLEASGLGEVDVILVSCFLVPLISYYLQTSKIKFELLIICIPLALLTLSLILVTEILDYPADKATGKTTMVVRLGRSAAIWLSGIALTVGWLIFSGVVVCIWPFWGWVSVVISLPLLIFVGINMITIAKKSEVDIKMMEWTGLVNSLLIGYAGLCLTASFIIR